MKFKIKLYGSGVVLVLKLNNGLVQLVETLQQLSSAGQRRQNLQQRIKDRSPLASFVYQAHYFHFSKQEVDQKDEAEHKEESGDQG